MSEHTNGSRDVWVHRMAMCGLIAISLTATVCTALVDPGDQGARAGLVAIASGSAAGLVAALGAARRAG